MKSKILFFCLTIICIHKSYSQIHRPQLYFTREVLKYEYNMLHYFEIKGMKDTKVQDKVNRLLRAWVMFDHNKFLESKYGPSKLPCYLDTDTYYRPSQGIFAFDTSFCGTSSKIYYELKSDEQLGLIPKARWTDSLLAVYRYGYKYSFIKDSILHIRVSQDYCFPCYDADPICIYINLNTGNLIDFYSNFKTEDQSSIQAFIRKKVAKDFALYTDEFGIKYQWDRERHPVYYDGIGENPRYYCDSIYIHVLVYFRKGIFSNDQNVNYGEYDHEYEYASDLFRTFPISLIDVKDMIKPNSLFSILLK